MMLVGTVKTTLPPSRGENDRRENEVINNLRGMGRIHTPLFVPKLPRNPLELYQNTRLLYLPDSIFLNNLAQRPESSLRCSGDQNVDDKTTRPRCSF